MHLVEACDRFQEVFGHDISELEPSIVATAIRDEIMSREEGLREVHATLVQHSVPGAELLGNALDQMRSIRTAERDDAILAFNAAYKELKEATKRGAELASVLTPRRLQDIERARDAMDAYETFLKQESDISEEVHDHADKLDDLLRRETFFREFAAIKQHERPLAAEYKRRHEAAAAQRAKAYRDALETLRGKPNGSSSTRISSSMLLDRY